MENNNKKKIKVLTIGIVLAVVFLAVGTYAFWTMNRIQQDDNVVIGKCLNLEFSNTDYSTGINLEDVWPISAEEALLDDNNLYTFKITNNCDHEQDYLIGIEDITTSSTKFSYSSISVALDNKVIGSLNTLDNTDPVLNANDSAKILGYGTLPAKVDDVPGEKIHEVRIWINETSSNSEIGYAFSSKIFVVAGQYRNGEKIINEGPIKKGTLAYMMKQNADTETEIDFSVQSRVSGTNGIYMTTNTDSGEPVYYYRGTVDNNLKWAGFCWKIIRTTETGGTKIIYNGTPNASGGCTNNGGAIGDSAYNSTRNDNTYVGYMWGSYGASTYAATHSNLKDSTIKTMIDTWYENNLKDNTVYLEDTVYCNDRNLVAGGSENNNNLGTSTGVLGYGTKRTGYGSLAKSSYFTLSANPSLVCKNTTGYVPEDNDAFTVSSIIGNGKLKYPVGLITTDELIYAGFSTVGNGSNFRDDNFLSSSSVMYWTMTPVYMDSAGDVAVGLVDGNYVTAGMVNYNERVRPVVSLRPGTQIISGFGTQGDPYVVE